MKFKHIQQIGVEIEGGWRREKFLHPKNKHLFHADNSVNITDQLPTNLRNTEGYVSGEVQTPPMNTLNSIEVYMKKFYPEFINETCGFHIHISLKSDEDYCKLMEKKFYSFLLKKFTAWGTEHKNNGESALALEKFWGRLEGHNSFCKKEFRPTIQVRSKEKCENRYTHLNFCYGLHGTVEFRLLPMFDDKKLSLSALRYYVLLVEQYLSLKSVKDVRISRINSATTCFKELRARVIL